MNTTYLVLLAAGASTGLTVGPTLQRAGLRLIAGVLTGVALFLLVAELLQETV